MKEKITLTVLEVLEMVTLPKGGHKHLFKARTPDAKEFTCFTFSDKIAEYIKKDSKIQVDVETETREVNGNTYVDRKIVQLYQDGQPVAGQNKFQPRQENTEAQTAAKIAGEWITNGIIKLDDPLGKLAYNWCLSRLNSHEVKPESRAPEIKTENKSDPEWDKLDKKTFKDAEDFKQTVYGKYFLTANQLVADHPDVVKLAKAGKLTEAWEVLETTIKALNK